jgi:hypothetical protein
MEKRYAEALGLSVEELSDFGKVRKGYKKKMLTVIRNRAGRINLNRAYSETCARLFKSTLSSLELVIISSDL